MEDGMNNNGNDNPKAWRQMTVDGIEGWFVPGRFCLLTSASAESLNVRL